MDECVQTLGMQTCERGHVQKCVYVMSAFVHICMYLYRLKGQCVSMQMYQRKYVRVHMHMSICVCDCGYGAALEA